MSKGDRVIYCRLIGGPLDGTTTSQLRGTQTIVMNSDPQASDETRIGLWHVYRRSDPEIRTREGKIEFHFVTTSDYPIE